MAYLGNLGAEAPPASSATQSAISNLLSPLTGALTSAAQQAADPLVQKIQPMLRDELTRQIPTFAIYAGITMGALVLIGIYTGILTTKQRTAGRRR